MFPIFDEGENVPPSAVNIPQISQPNMTGDIPDPRGFTVFNEGENDLPFANAEIPNLSNKRIAKPPKRIRKNR